MRFEHCVRTLGCAPTKHVEQTLLVFIGVSICWKASWGAPVIAHWKEGGAYILKGNDSELVIWYFPTFEDQNPVHSVSEWTGFWSSKVGNMTPSLLQRGFNIPSIKTEPSCLHSH